MVQVVFQFMLVLQDSLQHLVHILWQVVKDHAWHYCKLHELLSGCPPHHKLGFPGTRLPVQTSRKMFHSSNPIKTEHSDDNVTWNTSYLCMWITRPSKKEKCRQILGPTRSCGYSLLCSTFLFVGDVQYAAWWEETSSRETAGWNILLQNRHFLETEQIMITIM